MNDSIFFCIVNRNEHYYLGYFKTDTNGYRVPATSAFLSEALKLTFKEEAQKISEALGRKSWSVKQCTA